MAFIMNIEYSIVVNNTLRTLPFSATYKKKILFHILVGNVGILLISKPDTCINFLISQLLMHQI